MSEELLKELIELMKEIRKTLVLMNTPQIIVQDKSTNGTYDCGCPSNTFCNNTACPRASRITQ